MQTRQAAETKHRVAPGGFLLGLQTQGEQMLLLVQHPFWNPNRNTTANTASPVTSLPHQGPAKHPYSAVTKRFVSPLKKSYTIHNIKAAVRTAKTPGWEDCISQIYPGI